MCVCIPPTHCPTHQASDDVLRAFEARVQCSHGTAVATIVKSQGSLQLIHTLAEGGVYVRVDLLQTRLPFLHTVTHCLPHGSAR